MRKKAVWCAVIVALFAAPAAAQGQAPNRLSVVQRVSAEDPARFACAHTGRDCEADWIVAVAQALHAEDARWGLNGKRGNPDDISLDVVVFRIGPTDRHVQAFDICGACGGTDSNGNPTAHPVWNDITNWATIGQPGTAVYVKPPSGPPPVEPPPVPTPGPIVPAPGTPPVDLTPILDRLAALETLLTAKLDGIAAVSVEARDTAYQARDHAHEILNGSLPKVLDALAVRPCYAGSQGGWAGGKIRLCPEP